MKKLLLLLFLMLGAISSQVNAQGRNAQYREEKGSSAEATKIFNDSDPAFKVKEIPDKWKNESAVIVAQSLKYKFLQENKKLAYEEITRKRIKVLDKAAVDYFSTFYCYSGTKESKDLNFGIQLVKPDGTVKKIEKKDAAKVDADQVKGLYRSNLVSTDLTYYKLAIADLEPGDILDYFIVVRGEFYNFGMAAAFPRVMTTINGEYSILDQKIEMTVERGFFVNFKAINGAPELKKLSTSERTMYYYALADKDRDRVDGGRWLYEYRDLPTIKFQVCYSPIGRDSRYFLGNVNDITSSVTKEVVAEKVNHIYSTIVSDGLAESQIKSYMRRDHGRPVNKEDIARWTYYYFRNYVFAEGRDKGVVRDEYFVKVMRNVLKEYDIECEVCVAPHREKSRLDDVIISDELLWFVKIGNNYVFPFTVNSNYNQIPSEFQDQDAYQVAIEKRKEAQIAKKFTIPKTKFTENNSVFDFNISLDDEKENLVVTSKTSVKGTSRENFVYALKYNKWWETDYLAFGGKKPEDEKPTSRNKNVIAEEERKKKAEADERQKNEKDRMKDLLETDFANVVSYDSFKLESDGRSMEKPDIVYSESYKLGDMVRKVGANYTIELGGMIGSQVAIEKSEVKRDENIWLDFARSAEFNIVLEIPAGYKATGLDAFKSNIDNNTGSFIVNTKMEGQKLIVNVKKNYKENYLAKEEWQKMMEFLDAAFNFSQKKIVLTKV